MLQEIREEIDPETGEEQIHLVFSEGVLAVDSPVGLSTPEAIAILEGVMSLARALLIPRDPSKMN